MPKVVKSVYDRQTEDYIHTIKKGMVEKDMTQKDLARKSQLSEPTVCRALRDLDHLSFGNLRAMAKAVGVEIIIRGESNG